MFRRADTVSYTHLDVYKRQILYINVDEKTLVCQVEHSEENVGESVMVKFGMEHLYFFDKNTTKLVLYAKASDDHE